MSTSYHFTFEKDWRTAPVENPETYRSFVEEYFELEVDAKAISRVFSQEALSEDLLAAFPSSRSFQEISKEAGEIGYPVKR